MSGPYRAEPDGRISYRGNRQHAPLDDVSGAVFPADDLGDRHVEFSQLPTWKHLLRIKNGIHRASVKYFQGIGAEFIFLPLTTYMISSPGAVYGKEAINYTTDTSPVSLKWFDVQKEVFLSESSQIYLELGLLTESADHVYSIYNSFRKEPADFCHLSEFHHIEYEGRVSQKENVGIAFELLRAILSDLLLHQREDLEYFLTSVQIDHLQDLLVRQPVTLTFVEAMKLLETSTGEKKYADRSQQNFGAWEEILLTELTGSLTIVTEFPLLEVPFYHTMTDDKERALNADFIWPGYREFIGSGQRITDIAELEEKARIFNLPREDYEPYLRSRTLRSFRTTSGFGLGVERLIQGILCLPYIWDAGLFPRGHMRPSP